MRINIDIGGEDIERGLRGFMELWGSLSAGQKIQALGILETLTGETAPGPASEPTIPPGPECAEMRWKRQQEAQSPERVRETIDALRTSDAPGLEPLPNSEPGPIVGEGETAAQMVVDEPERTPGTPPAVEPPPAPEVHFKTPDGTLNRFVPAAPKPPTT